MVVVVGEPGTGKTSLCGSLEQTLLQNDRVLLGKILDPAFSTEMELLIAVGRVFGLSLPPRSSAALKNALKNFFFETGVLEGRTAVLVVDEAQNLTDEGLEALRTLLNYQVPEKKLLNILLFGQNELESRIAAQGNLADRVDSWIRLQPLDETAIGAVLDFRMERAGTAESQTVFSSEARSLLIGSSAGLPRRLTALGHSSMEEAAGRASTLVREDHVRAALTVRGLKERVAAHNGSAAEPRGQPGFFQRLFGRLKVAR